MIVECDKVMDSTCSMFYDAKYLCFAPGWAVYGVWCEMYQVTVPELWLSGLFSRFSLDNHTISLLWLAESAHVLVCESMLLWPSVTPVTSVNTRHKLFSSQFTKLPGVTNQHQLTCDPINVGEIEKIWAVEEVGLGSHEGCGTLLSQHDKCPHAYLQSFCQNFHNFNPFMQSFLPSLGKVWFNCSKKLDSWIKVQSFSLNISFCINRI